MHEQLIPLLLAAFAVAKPQSMDMNGLSSCAQGIVLAQIGATPCGSDVACVCKDTSFIRNLRNLINASCGESDATAADSFYRTTCANNGVTIDAGAATSTPASGATVTSTMSMISTQTDMPAASNMTMSSSVTGDPSMTATSDMMMASGTTLGGGMGSCVVATTTVCHTATMAPTSTGTNPSAFTGAADVVGISGALAGLAVMAALL